MDGAPSFDDLLSVVAVAFAGAALIAAGLVSVPAFPLSGLTILRRYGGG